jgi:hypothetical protein
MSVLADLKKSLKTHHILVLLGLVVAAVAIMQYSRNKSVIMSGLQSAGAGVAGLGNTGAAAASAMSGSPQFYNMAAGGNGASPSTAANLGNDPLSHAAPVMGGNMGMAGGLPSCSSQPVTNPAELLPKDVNSEWAKLNPRAAGDFQNVNLLRAGYWTGIDTVGSTLRNANLQVRSEPPNPTNVVSPWNNTTIAPDLMRVPLEIGQGCQ